MAPGLVHLFGGGVKPCSTAPNAGVAACGLDAGAVLTVSDDEERPVASEEAPRPTTASRARAAPEAEASAGLDETAAEAPKAAGSRIAEDEVAEDDAVEDEGDEAVGGEAADPDCPSQPRSSPDEAVEEEAMESEEQGAASEAAAAPRAGKPAWHVSARSRGDSGCETPDPIHNCGQGPRPAETPASPSRSPKPGDDGFFERFLCPEPARRPAARPLLGARGLRLTQRSRSPKRRGKAAAAPTTSAKRPGADKRKAAAEEEEEDFESLPEEERHGVLRKWRRLAGKSAAVEARRLQILVAAIIHPKASESCVERAIARLSDWAGPEGLHADRLAATRAERLEELLEGVHWARIKAQRVSAAAAAVVEDHGGKVPSERSKLLTLPGVGPRLSRLLCFVLASEVATEFAGAAEASAAVPSGDELD